MAGALLAQSAIDRLQSAACELILVIDGESSRRRQKPGLDVGGTTPEPAAADHALDLPLRPPRPIPPHDQLQR